MGIDVAHAAASVDFLEAYAKSCIDEAEAMRNRDEPLDRDREWTVLMDAATALRDAGQWAACIAPGRARILLDRSGALFARLNQPYGGFLRVAAGPWFEQPRVDVFGEWLRDVERLQGSLDDLQNQPVLDALRHPQQQAYLLLAAVGSPQVRQEFGVFLSQMVRESAHRRGVVPVGALGIPIRRLWRVSAALLGEAENPPDAVAEEIAGLARRYAESMELAAANEFTWRNAGAPVDVGDIDIFGIASLASRAFGHAPMQETLERRMRGEPRTAHSQVEMAMEFATPGYGSDALS
jgi:hypothetical protein